MFNFLFGLHNQPFLIAQDGSGILPIIEGYDPVILLKDAVAWAIIAAVVLCIVFIFVGGLSFILSGGQEDKVKQAVSTIRYAIIGLVVVILSVTMVNVILFVFKVPFKFVDYREILNKVYSISDIFRQNSTYDSSGL
jgi:uncharacterized protein YacL